MVSAVTAALRVPAYPLVHVVLFQATWFAAVLGGAAGLTWPGVATLAVLIALHLAVRPDPRATAWCLALVALLGCALDTSLGLLGVCRYVGGGLDGALAPLWMVALWPAFASALDASCSWLVSRFPLAIAFGALGGPLAYLAGERLGALTFPAGTGIGLAVVAVEWALAMAVIIPLWRRRVVA